MIIWFNNKITDLRRTPIGNRHGLKNSNRFDVARYGFASFAVLDPIVSKFVFNLELADTHAGREPEMEAWLRSVFPADKLQIEWHRCNTIPEWSAKEEELKKLNDDVIYLAATEDYVFMDSTVETWKKGIEAISADTDPTATLLICHHPEALSESRNRGTLSSDKNFGIYNNLSSVAIQVMKMQQLHNYLEYNKDRTDIGDASPNRYVYTLDNFHAPGNAKFYVTTKELCRHFDGYGPSVDPAKSPPIDIPLGFFEKEMVIKYGFTDRDPNCVNINPLAVPFVVDTVNGTDYRFTLDDIPLFWKPFIKEIIVADGIDHAAMLKARNQYYIDAGCAANTSISEEWFLNHLI